MSEMSEKDLIPCVKNSIDAIIASEKISSPTIEVAPGSEIGDGYASKTLAITIKGDEKTISLFVKYFPENSINSLAYLFSMAFNVEFRFYDQIYPEMADFQQKKNLPVEELFDNVPKHYKIGIKHEGIPPIVLENLKVLGYTMRNHKEPIDEAHLTLALKAFAKYHALSFAMKDQQPEQFKKLHDGMKDFYAAAFKTMGLDDSLGSMMDAFVSSLDPVKDRHLWNECKNLRELLIEHACNVHNQVDDYAVICQGDCWSNNMMFKYDKATGSPIDVKLIDFQVQRYNSPVLDVSYFFYSVATDQILDNFNKYYNFYYNTLAAYVKALGSEPRKVYPKVVFSNHWKKFAKFGLTMAFGAFMAQVMNPEETMNLIDSETPTIPTMPVNFEHKDKYFGRIRHLLEHFIERDFL